MNSRNQKLSLLAVCLGFFMVMIDVTVVNVALPTIASTLHANIQDLQWVVDGYTLTFACLLLTAGKLADQKGAKKTFILGVTLFVLTSIGCALALNTQTLIIFRLLKGISAALTVPSSLALITLSYPDKKEKAKAIAIWASMGGIAAATGPILGSFLTASLSWRAVFFINVPIGLLAVYLTIKYVSVNNKIHSQDLDLPGQLAAIVSISTLAFTLIDAGRNGWFALPVILGFLIFLISFCLFLWIESKAKHPMLPLKLFKSSTFSSAIVIGLILNISFYGQLFLLPLFFQNIKSYSIFLTGLAILPQTALSALASYIGGRLASTIGPKVPISIGFTVGMCGFLAMVFINPTTHYLYIMLPLAAIGFGVTFSLPAATTAIIHSTTPELAGISSGAFNASRQVGSLIGVALFGTIINTATTFMFGMHASMLLGTLLFLLGLITTLLWIE